MVEAFLRLSPSRLLHLGFPLTFFGKSNTIFIMKIMMFFCLCFFSFASFARSIEACNLEIKELNAERLTLSKEPFVEYRKEDHPSSAIERRSRLILVNRKFATTLKPCTERWSRAHSEWLSLLSSIPASERRKARLAEIRKRLKEIEIEKFEILKNRYQKK